MSEALTSLEIATGIVYGDAPAEPGGGRAEPGDAPAEPGGGPQAGASRAPLRALEDACLAALRRPPCLVSFSGGLDSSLVLAVAARVARREGLPLPVPATNRFPLAGASDESRWQGLVVRHLGLDDWIRLELTDELDVVGPLATRGLRRHGLLWPFNAHFHVPLLEAARGGTLLTGVGGDEVFGRSRWARRAGRARARDLARLALLASPWRVRRAVLARRVPAAFPWLTPEAQREFAYHWAGDEAAEPHRLGSRLRRLGRRRWLRTGLRSLDLLGGDASAAIAHPLVSPAFKGALAASGPRHGHRDRASAIESLLGGLLPQELIARTTKARFEGAFWAAPSRALAASWAGEGADPRLVDSAALRAHWSEAEPDAHSYLLLQAAWLSRDRKKDRLDLRPVAPSAARPYA